MAIAKHLEHRAEPGTLRVSAAAHAQLAYCYPWEKPAQSSDVQTDSWVLGVDVVLSGAAKLGKRRSAEKGADPLQFHDEQDVHRAMYGSRPCRAWNMGS